MMVWQLARSACLLVAAGLLVYGLVWNFSTRRYLKGFVDAIIPLTGSPEEKTVALVGWFHHEPQRYVPPPAWENTETMSERDPVNIVQNARLLTVCGSASNAFMNLADVAGLKVRRLLLLNPSGGTMHVVAEVRWGDRWIVVNPSQGFIFMDSQGRALTRQELRDPAVFRDAISRMPGYDPTYIFDHTRHLRLQRIPILGVPLRRVFDRFAPGWDEWMNWSYLPENPSLCLVLASLPLFLAGLVVHLLMKRHGRRRQGKKSAELISIHQ